MTLELAEKCFSGNIKEGEPFNLKIWLVTKKLVPPPPGLEHEFLLFPGFRWRFTLIP